MYHARNKPAFQPSKLVALSTAVPTPNVTTPSVHHVRYAGQPLRAACGTMRAQKASDRTVVAIGIKWTNDGSITACLPV